MLKQWGLGNFKSFYEETKLDLAPLTILTGGNSSGKSSFIQSMLLIAQTFDYPFEDTELLLNGSYVELGFLKDNLSDPTKDFFVSFSYLASNLDFKKINVEYSLNFNINEKLLNMKCSCHEIQRDSNDENKGNFTVRRAKNGDIVLENYDGFFEPDLEIYGDPIKANGIKVTLNKFLPEYYYFAPDHPKMVEINKKALFEFLKDLNDQIPDTFDHIKDDIIKTLLTRIRILLDKDNNDSPDNITEINSCINKLNEVNLDHRLYDFNDFIYHYMDDAKIIDVVPSERFSILKDFLEEEFSLFRYIAPLRFKGAIHPISLNISNKGPGSGENLAAIFNKVAEGYVDYLSPKYISNYSESFLNKEILTFKKALENWLEYLEIAKEIKVEQIDNIGFSLKIKPFKHKAHDSDGFLDLTQVGTGISQVLPILAMGLLAEKNSILLFEQPELHLHPPMQARLADFFISLALLGKQCIIESHSEYFIDIFRARISKSLLNNSEHIKNITKIYFFEKGDSGTKVIPIEINEYAGYTDWPEGFFEERHKIDEEILDNLNEKITYEGEDDSEQIND